MKKFRLFCVVLLAFALSGCSTSQVMSVAASPDGKSVIAVGARLRSEGFGWYYSDPLQWYCQRGTDGRLACQTVAGQVPKLAR
jgi:uncharacterized protein YceK